MSAESHRSIRTRIRSLQLSKSSGTATKESIRYAWMNGLRMKVSDMLDLAPGDEVLDVGCGDGWFSVQNGLRYPEVQFTGIDLYEAGEAREISRLMGATNCRFYKMDALKMSIGRKFDSVVLFMALGNICETSSSVGLLLTNCMHLMKKDAKLLIVEPFEEDFPVGIREKVLGVYRLYKAMGKSRGEDHETVLSRNTALRALEDSGFCILKILNRRFAWYMKRDEVMRYFGLESSTVDVPERFWVFDKPRQITIVLAEESH